MTLSKSIKSEELFRFLNFNNIPEIVIFLVRFLFLYSIFLSHLLLYFIFSNYPIKNYVIVNFFILVFAFFKLISWNLKRGIKLTGFIFLAVSQAAIFCIANLTIIIGFNVFLIVNMFVLYRYKCNIKYI